MAILPKSRSKYKVLVICEGYEEYEYFECIVNLGVFDKDISITLENAEGITKNGAKNDHLYRQGKYDFVCVFCDTDHKPYESFENIVESINNHVDGMAEFVIFYGNPVTMQIVLLHFGDVKLASNQKSDNVPIIEELTGVSNYSAKESQRKVVNSYINKDNYILMKERVTNLSHNYKDTSSSNFIKLLNYLENHKLLDEVIRDIDELTRRLLGN